MLNIDISQICTALVEQLLLPRNGESGRDSEALHFHFDLRMNHSCGDGDRFSASRALHLLYYLPKGLSYISVFSAVLDNPFDKIDQVSEWKFVTCHDSCWKDNGVFFETYMAMANEINAALETAGYHKVAPNDMSQFCNFAMFGDAFRWVPCEVKKDPTDRYNYRQIITLLK